MNIRRTAAALTSAAALSVVGVAGAAPASAAPLFTGGLVNIAITDTLNDNNVLNDVTVIAQVPVGVAANVCNVSVAVLGAFVPTPAAPATDCTASTTQDLPVRFR